MDKTIEIVLVATVVIMTGAAVMYLFSGQIGEFDESASNEANVAECQTIKTRAESGCFTDGQLNSQAETEFNNKCTGSDVNIPVEQPSCN